MMERLLLMVGSARNRSLLERSLAKRYTISAPSSAERYLEELEGPFDLCIADSIFLRQYSDAILEHKEEQYPVFLPVLLVAPRRQIPLVPGVFWKVIDDVIGMPVALQVLHTRVEIMLRQRRQSLELDLRQDELEAFIQAMTHDLRAPTRLIKGYAEAIKEDEAPSLSRDGLSHLDRIDVITDNVLDLINDLLEYTKLGKRSAPFVNVDVFPVVEKVFDFYAQEAEVKDAKLEVEPFSAIVEGDRLLLEIALRNLVSNALKFVAPGVKPYVRIRASEIRGWCRIEVSDNGIGISDADRSRIFEPFTRLHGVEEYPGTGLGLSIVRKAVQMMGGRIGVISSEEKGSIFWVELRRGDKT